MALEAIDSSERFERLASTLLLPIYPDLNPIGGTGDRGRDATARLYRATDPTGQLVIFQSSYEKTWEAKLKRDLNKTRRNELNPARYVFVTNRCVSGAKRAHYEGWVKESYGWEFEIYDQEWFLARLESPENLHLRQDCLGLAPDTIPLFLSPEHFARRQARGAVGGHQLPLVGRSADLEGLQTWLDGDTPILVLHGTGGSGKTRLCIEFARTLEREGSPWTPVFVRSGAEQFEPHVSELTPGNRYLVIVDDAHRFDHTRGLGELLANPALGPVKLLLNTRPVFKDHVVTFAAGRYKVQEQAIGRLKRADLDQLIRQAPFNLRDATVRNIVLDIAQGSPLVAQAAADLAARGEDLRSLSADDALRRRFDQIVADVLGPDNAQGRDYLAALVGLGGIDLAQPELRDAVRARLGLSESDEERILSTLIQAGIVQRGYSALRIVPDVLADHLLLRWFLDPEARQYDFRTFILEPFFAFKSADILRNLAEAEYKGKSREAGSLLSGVLQDLGTRIAGADNFTQLRILSWVRSFGVLRPDEALYVVAQVVDGPDQPATFPRGPQRGRQVVERWTVLREAVDVLGETKYVRVRNSLAYLYKLSRWGAGTATDSGAKSVRTEATKSIKELLELKPTLPRSISEEGLVQVECWLQEEPESHTLCVELLEGLLKVRVNWVERSPEDRNTVIWSQSLLPPSPALRSLRDRAFAALRELYCRTTSAHIRQKIIDAHGELVVYDPHQPDAKLQAFLNEDIEASIAFSNARLDEGTELYERFALWAWAMDVERHRRYRRKDLRALIQRLEADPMHAWYLNLAEYGMFQIRPLIG